MSDQPADCVGCGIGRRDFLSSAALTLLASSLAAACGDGQIGGVAGPVNPPGGTGGLVVRLADFPALATVGGIARVDGGSSNPVAAVRLGPSSFVALSMICPHASFRPIQITSPGFRCPNHGAEFAPAGEWVGGQRTSDLPRFNVVYDAAAGTLTIT